MFLDKHILSILKKTFITFDLSTMLKLIVVEENKLIVPYSAGPSLMEHSIENQIREEASIFTLLIVTLIWLYF